LVCLLVCVLVCVILGISLSVCVSMCVLVCVYVFVCLQFTYPMSTHLLFLDPKSPVYVCVFVCVCVCVCSILVVSGCGATFSGSILMPGTDWPASVNKRVLPGIKVRHVLYTPGIFALVPLRRLCGRCLNQATHTHCILLSVNIVPMYTTVECQQACMV